MNVQDTAHDVFQDTYALDIHELDDRQSPPPGQGSRPSSQASADTKEHRENSSAAAETMALHDALGNIMMQLHSINDRLEELEKTRATSPTDASSSTPPQVHGLPKSSLQPSPIMQKHPSATPFSKGTFTTPSAVHPRIHGGALSAKTNEAKEMPLKAKLRRFPGQGQ